MYCWTFSRFLALIYVLTSISLAQQCHNRLNDQKTATAMNVLGRWKKTTKSACSDAYPAIIEFKSNGLYSAEADPQAKLHPRWDVGTFTVGTGQISLSTSTDAVVAYKVSQTSKQLTFEDPDGCTITYQKQ